MFSGEEKKRNESHKVLVEKGEPLWHCRWECGGIGAATVGSSMVLPPIDPGLGNRNLIYFLKILFIHF